MQEFISIRVEWPDAFRRSGAINISSGVNLRKECHFVLDVILNQSPIPVDDAIPLPWADTQACTQAASSRA